MPHQYKILLMEDDRLYNLFLKQFLEGCGFTVVESWSLKECRALLREEQPDAIICDVGVAAGPEPTSRYLPLGGLTVLDWLGRQDGMPWPEKVIVISSTMTDGIRKQCEERGVTAIFEKPFDPSRLVKVLKQPASGRV